MNSDMDAYCMRSDPIRDDSLERWSKIGSGGFGQIYRARHTEWGIDVAVKALLCEGSVSTLQREASLMFQGGNPNVLRIFGLYEGNLGIKENPSQFGLVMEFMERGSLADLLQNLGGPPAWPLAFRLSHQIGLGMNFLHHLSPSLLHLDLKPSNVLLDDSLNAKLTDFGLSRAARSLSKCVREQDEMEGGTLSYMPPEALKSVNYKPSKASDVYSYGVLLWSIITGQEPYRNVPSSLVRFRIPEGDRPDLKLIDCSQADGLGDIVKLMERCWEDDPSQRLTFRDCVNVTEKIFEKHKRGVIEAVNDVLKQLDNDICSSLKSIQITPKPQNVIRPPLSHCVTGPPPKQETAGDRNKDSRKTESSSHPIPANKKIPQKTPQRQTSSPGGVHIHMSNVSGVQIGNGNFMNIVQRPRQRHKTAPPSVDRTLNNSEKTS
ncbi:receptor-interacting serine/threonine-protein kinase 3 isoform X2 [Misgurnus anguillicaudatus]|uniref:receptor-interacting serine/threonine-protein kinase 3 isoform X2 n=1 Tax=Misgurnus anguillicaudatus TaxID=75329 RepID=UPI00243566F8|nr:receptor-interacting serine/threonine-protein kinase 3 isoform X2 [Misgurnus anguillicaudatus]